jgi:hypothetical protein
LKKLKWHGKVDVNLADHKLKNFSLHPWVKHNYCRSHLHGKSAHDRQIFRKTHPSPPLFKLIELSQNRWNTVHLLLPDEFKAGDSQETFSPDYEPLAKRPVADSAILTGEFSSP